MNFKLAVVSLFALVAACQAGYAILNSYSDSSCSGASLIASFATNDPSACMQKRSIQQQLTCNNETIPGVNFTYDFAFCSNDSIPSFPAGWQVLQLATESTCNATADKSVTNFLAAPQEFTNTLIAFASQAAGGLTAANTSLSCSTASGNLTVSTCVTIKGVGNLCIGFDLEKDVCTLDASSSYFGLQSTCVVAPPVAEPVATPEAGSPVAPTTTPVKTPAKASSASIVYSSAALLSLVALL